MHNISCHFRKTHGGLQRPPALFHWWGLMRIENVRTRNAHYDRRSLDSKELPSLAVLVLESSVNFGCLARKEETELISSERMIWLYLMEAKQGRVQRWAAGLIERSASYFGIDNQCLRLQFRSNQQVEATFLISARLIDLRPSAAVSRNITSRWFLTASLYGWDCRLPEKVKIAFCFILQEYEDYSRIIHVLLVGANIL